MGLEESLRIHKELVTARRVVVNLLRIRKSRRRVNAALRTHPLPAPKSVQIAIYFADDEVNLYQVRQWYAPMAELAKTWPVTIISRSPTAALALWDEAPVPVVYLRSVASLENFVDEQDLRIVFYINQNARNFQMFRYGEMWHVFINHGESDKMYMTTNQFKAYDYSLIAGEAARDRLERTLWNFDLDARTRMIGRPQADHLTGTPPYPSDDRTTVLYAPTWEGDRPAAAYGSVASHGVRLVDGLLATGRHRVIYRPHPRSGVVDHGYARANRSIIAAIARANAADPSAQHVYDTSSALGWQLAMTDVAITDISAMIYDRLATGKPLLVTRPVAAGAEIDRGGYLEDAEWLEAAESADIVELVDRVLYSDAAKQKLSWWVERYFGDTSPGAATARLHAAVQDLMDEWDVHAGRNGKAE
ncbi:CDP-glycerol glycerophosphotransferase family protein [Glaciihabitans tibetensis]|uniref:CDP-glycerol glycerophosphotransferase family protein n=1 Tax=Glaciihabitans tibetensis TaxID=1266600 RepID=UPI0011B24FF6